MKWRLLAGALFAGMIALLLWPNPALPFSGPPERWKNGLHAPFFLILSLILFVFTPSHKSLSTRLIITLILVLSLAATTEAIQPFFNRSASLHDLLFNLAGILIAVSGLWIFLGPVRRPSLRWIHPLVSITLLLSFFYPVVAKLRSHDWLESRQPVLSNFGDSRSQHFWISQGHAHLTFDDGLLTIFTHPEFWSGVNFFPGTQDWRGHEALVLEIDHPGEPFPLGIRVDDDRTDSYHGARYNGVLTIQQGSSRHRIALDEIATGPEQGKLNLGAITRLALFVEPKEPPREFVLKRAFLE